jgi:hypothetical protein
MDGRGQWNLADNGPVRADVDKPGMTRLFEERIGNEPKISGGVRDGLVENRRSDSPQGLPPDDV